jgi:hypothetical protein
MTWYTATQTNGEVSPTSTKRLNPNALPFSPILKANVFTFSPVTSPDSAAWTNGAATSTFPTSTTRLNPNALPFSPDQKTNAFSPVILPEAGATPTFPTSTARLNSNALPFWPRKAFTSVILTGYRILDSSLPTDVLVGVIRVPLLQFRVLRQLLSRRRLTRPNGRVL